MKIKKIPSAIHKGLILDVSGYIIDTYLQSNISTFDAMIDSRFIYYQKAYEGTEYLSNDFFDGIFHIAYSLFKRASSFKNNRNDMMNDLDYIYIKEGEVLPIAGLLSIQTMLLIEEEVFNNLTRKCIEIYNGFYI